MEIDWLKTFLAVYRAGSMGKAAQALSVTQPAVSQHVAALESRLDAPLFRRSRRGVTPTPIADGLARDVAHALDSLEYAISSRKVYSPDITGLIHIGAAPEVFAIFGVRLITAFQDTKLRFELHSAARPKLFELLEEGITNLALGITQPDHNKFESEKIDDDRLLLVGSPEVAERLHGRTRKHERLHEIPLITNSRDLMLVQRYWNGVFSENINVTPTVVIPDLQCIVSICSQMSAWSVLPQCVLGEKFKSGELVNLLPEASVNAHLYIVWKKQALRTPRIAFAVDRIKQIWSVEE